MLWIIANDLQQADNTDITGSSVLVDHSGLSNNYSGGFQDFNAYPKYKTNQVNGLDAILFNNFNGGNRGQIQKASGSWTLSTTWAAKAASVFYVLKKAATFTDFHQFTFSSDDFNGDGAPNSTAYNFDSNMGGDNKIYECMFIASRVSFTPGVTITNWHLYELIVTDSTYDLYQNGSLQSSTNPASFYNSGNVPGIIGAANYGSIYGWYGYMAEIIWYNLALGATDRQTVEQYLNNKYALGF